MSGPTARGREGGRDVRSEIWFWTWALAALGVVLVPTGLWLCVGRVSRQASCSIECIV